MSQSFFGPTPGGGGGGATVQVTNFPSPQLVNINQAAQSTDNGVFVTNSSSNPLPVNVNYSGATPGKIQLVDSSGNPISNNTWSGGLSTTLASEQVLSTGSIVNRVVEAISTGVETDTLTRPASCSNFLAGVVFNPTSTDCTFTIGTTNTTTATCKAASSYPFDCNVTKLVLHATASGQQINGWVFDPSVT